MPELSVEAVIGTARHQLGEHVGCCGIATAVELCTAHEKQCLGDMAFPRAGVSCNHETLFAPHEVQLRDLRHLGLVHSRLEYEVEVCKKFSFRES